MKTKEQNYAKEQAEAQLSHIKTLVARLDPDCPHEGSDALEAIQEDPLDVSVRTGWYPAGEANHKAEEYLILLCTGGPAVRIIGRLTDFCEPDTASLQYQDWGTPWTNYRTTQEEEEALLAYARCFYFGE